MKTKNAWSALAVCTPRNVAELRDLNYSPPSMLFQEVRAVFVRVFLINYTLNRQTSE